MNASGARLVRIPLVPVAVCMVIGILAGRFVPLPAGLWAVVGGAALAAAAGLAFRPHLRGAAQAALLGAILCLSAVHSHLAYFAVPDDHVVTCTGTARTLATLRGRIITAPQIVRPLPGESFAYPREPQTVFLLEAKGLGAGERRREVRGSVRVTIEEPVRGLAIGQELELVGWIGRIRTPANPGQYDAAQTGRYNGVLVWCSVPMASGVRPAESAAGWRQRILDRFRASAAQHFAGGSDEESGILAQALLVGQRHPALGRLNEIMVQAGIAHYLSISGSHLAIFLGFVYFLCRLAALSRRRSSGLVLAVLIVYVAVAEPNAPLMRSAIMAGAMCLAGLARRRASGLNSLAGAAALLLAVDPLDLFSAGFQLSFAIVLGLMLLHRPIHSLLWSRRLARQGLMVYRHEGRYRRWVAQTLANWFRGAVTISLSAWIASVPLAAWHFGLFSPYGQVLTALLALPVTLVLIPGYLSLGLAWLAPNLSDAFGRLAELAAGWLARIVDALRFLPGLCVEVRPVGPAWTALCYIVVALWFLRRRLPYGRSAAVVATLVLIGWTTYTQLPAAAPKGIELNLLAVGDGQCAVVRTPGDGVWLFDAGTQTTLDIRPAVLEPFLRDRCFRRPTTAFVSHANTDHYAAVADLASVGALRRVYLNEFFGRSADANRESYRNEMKFLHILERSGVQVQRLHAGMTVPLDGGVRVEVLWPPAEAPPKLAVNDTSLILRIVDGSGSVLLPGDAEAGPQAALLAGDANRLRSDVLVMPHHGSWGESLPALVKAVRPRQVLVSRGSEPRPPTTGKLATTAAAADFYSRLRSGDSYHSTARSGWIQVRLAPGELEVQTWRP